MPKGHERLLLLPAPLSVLLYSSLYAKEWSSGGQEEGRRRLFERRCPQDMDSQQEWTREESEAEGEVCHTRTSYKMERNPRRASGETLLSSSSPSNGRKEEKVDEDEKQRRRWRRRRGRKQQEEEEVEKVNEEERR